MTKPFTILAGALLAAGLATPALAGTAMEKALAVGAERLTANEIAARLAGKTVTFERASSGGRALVYYDGANGMLIRKVGSDRVIEGFYAVSDADHVCFGAKGDEPIRLHCVNVLVIDDQIHKFELDGSLRGRIVEEVEGNTT